MPHVASSNPQVAERLQAALDEEGLGVQTLARRIAAESGGEVQSWRSQLNRIRRGQQPERRTAVRIARALRRPDDYLFAPGPLDPQAFSMALLGQVVLLLEQEDGLAEQHPDLLLGLAKVLRDLAGRLEAAALHRAADTPPHRHG